MKHYLKFLTTPVAFLVAFLLVGVLSAPSGAIVPTVGGEAFALRSSDLPGGCGWTFYGCNTEGNQHNPNDPDSTFSYEESCKFCSDDDGGWFHFFVNVDFCSWDVKVVEINVCDGSATVSLGPVSGTIDFGDDDSDDDDD